MFRATAAGLVLWVPLAEAQGTEAPKAPPPPWAFSVGLGIQAPFLGMEGVSPLVQPGLRLMGSWQNQNLQFGLQGRIFAASAALTNRSTEAAQTIDVSATALDMSLRLGFGSFRAGDSLFAYVQPGLYSTRLQREDDSGTLGKVDQQLSEFAIEAGMGKIFKAGSTNLEVTASLVRVSTDPQQLRSRFMFAPGIFISLVLD